MVDSNCGLDERHAAATALWSATDDSTLLGRLPLELVDHILDLALPLHLVMAPRDPAVASNTSESESTSEPTLYKASKFVYQVIDDLGGQCFLTAMDDSVFTGAVDELLKMVPQDAAAAPFHEVRGVQEVDYDTSLATYWSEAAGYYVEKLLSFGPHHPDYCTPMLCRGLGADVVFDTMPKIFIGGPSGVMSVARAAFKILSVLTPQRLAALGSLFKSLSPGGKIVVNLVPKTKKSKDGKPWRPPSAATHRIKYSLNDGTHITDNDTISALNMVLDSVCCPKRDSGRDFDDFDDDASNAYARLVPHRLLSNGGEYMCVACDHDGTTYNEANPTTPTISVSSAYGTPYAPQLVSGTNKLVSATAVPIPATPPEPGMCTIVFGPSITWLRHKWPPTFGGIYTLKLGGEGRPPLSMAVAFAAWTALAIRKLPPSKREKKKDPGVSQSQ